ncbi:XrtA-associated tyrosine autokinase [Chitinimonas sp. BJB300]|uniref:XrtA-associated tyrosine autokinase n=1 Tax=Chitinimonas sp. BJB300 TaxID=1559339 RepID=UPI000C10D5F6|nr:XrtA-associated tyrosine autokinase [Chitinimonas sp. BJB300]PHV12123.1 chromosome partitioning ATPase [Chitinimonas sp. BJB300]TSJ89049.1 tyrosine-protein kinase family protein [Chitinimonas sp. BJB300]
MNLIEQAAKRLEELRLAGVEVPDSAPARHIEPKLAPIPTPVPTPAPVPVPAVAEKAPAPRPAVVPSPPVLNDAVLVKSRLVTLQMEQLAAAGLIYPNAPRSQLADEFRVIKRPLIANAMGKGAAPVKNGNLIMVTSALPHEGKSFTAANLAISIAMELDKTVMLVDADVARPSLLKMLGLPPAPGLLDVLVNETNDLSGVLLRTNIETLTILPSGTPHVRATELLASDAMNNLLEEMATRYPDRIIIFDSPPLLVTTESRVLAAHMGQIVMVVRAEGTLQSEVRHALGTIEACPVKMMLLNQVKSSKHSEYGYGYGYGYGG